MKKKVNLLIALICITMLLVSFPLSAFADDTDITDQTTNSITFDELEDLLRANSPQIEQNNSSIPSITGGVSDEQKEMLREAIENVTELLTLLQTGSPEPGNPPDHMDNVNSALVYLLEEQLISLQMQWAAANRDTGASDAVAIALLSVEARNAGYIYSMEMQYIGVKNMEQQIGLLNSRLESMKSQLKAMEIRQELGLVNKNTLDQFMAQFKLLQTQLRLLQESKSALLQQLNVALGEDFDSSLTLAELPEVREPEIAGMNLEEDYKAALIQSNSVDIADRGGNATDAENKFKMDFYRAYQNVQDKNQALAVEKINMEIAERNKQIADLKYTLGMMSALDYEEAKNTYLNSQTTLVAAKNALLQTYQQYQWALRGFTF